MFTPVMQYIEEGYNISLITDELRCQWFVMVNDKLLPCLGCQHGLDMFDGCVNKIREERTMN